MTIDQTYGLPPRFWQHVTRSETGCWTWTGRLVDGYGYVQVNGLRTRAHRHTYTAAAGPIPDGLVIDHTCRNRSCVRPDHLRAVTHRANILEPRAQGMGRQNLDKTHCPKGHPYTPENTYRESHDRPWRRCRTCQLAKPRKHP
jgi:hypothetical protein